MPNLQILGKPLMLHHGLQKNAMAAFSFDLRKKMYKEVQKPEKMVILTFLTF